jgi:short-subunit dehydrogenase
MNLQGKNILLTGASGGIGHPLAFALSSKGAKLALVGRDQVRITSLCKIINKLGGTAVAIATDFQGTEAIPEPAQYVVDEAIQLLGEIDILINNAGIQDFTLFAEQSSARIAQMMHINTVVPIQLARALVPSFLVRNSGQIVNIGSIFGSIGFPHFAVYSASKFAMHGFSQALRRELADSSIAVTYIAPRAIRTSMNNQVVSKMLAATNASVDDPREVVAQMIKAIEEEKHEYYIGQPESFFAWLNGVLPSAVNIGLKKQARIARQFVVNQN